MEPGERMGQIGEGIGERDGEMEIISLNCNYKGFQKILAHTLNSFYLNYFC